jgi:hypothetical protein
MTDEEIEHGLNENQALLKEARSISAERFGLLLHGYRLLDTDRNENLFESDRILWENRTGKRKENQPEKNGCLLWEETIPSFMGRGFGSGSLLCELIEFFGVTKMDIDNKSPRLKGYIFNMVEQGKLPTLKKFAEGIKNEI